MEEFLPSTLFEYYKAEGDSAWDGSSFWLAVRCYLKGEGYTGRGKKTGDVDRRKFKIRVERCILREKGCGC